jgi:hypothetical protein
LFLCILGIHGANPDEFIKCGADLFRREHGREDSHFQVLPSKDADEPALTRTPRSASLDGVWAQMSIRKFRLTLHSTKSGPSKSRPNLELWPQLGIMAWGKSGGRARIHEALNGPPFVAVPVILDNFVIIT